MRNFERQGLDQHPPLLGIARQTQARRSGDSNTTDVQQLRCVECSDALPGRCSAFQAVTQTGSISWLIAGSHAQASSRIPAGFISPMATLRPHFRRSGLLLTIPKAATLRSQSPAPSNTLSRCPRNRQQAIFDGKALRISCRRVCAVLHVAGYG